MDQEEYYSKHLVITWSKLGRTEKKYSRLDKGQSRRNTLEHQKPKKGIDKLTAEIDGIDLDNDLKRTNNRQ